MMDAKRAIARVLDLPDSVRWKYMSNSVFHFHDKASHLSMAQHFMQTARFGTICFSALLIILFPLRVWLPHDILRMFCLKPRQVLLSFQLYRVYTYHFIHNTLIHLVMNLVALIPLSIYFEKAVGTLQFLHLISILAYIVGFMHLVTLLVLISPSRICHCSILALLGFLE